MPDREALRAAVLKVLPVNTAITWDSAERLADNIVDAVMAVLDREPNDIEATGQCCCNGCIGQGMCDLAEPEEREAVS